MAKQTPQLTGTDLQSHNIVMFPVGAAAYAERAMRALERMQHDKALQYFRRAAEIEPNNPIHQCNLAGALAETGQYEPSNDILQHVVTHMETNMTECYYYMANNWAYLGRFDNALAMLEQYMELDPHGMYAEEAEAMLEMIQYELASQTKRGLPRNAQAWKDKKNDSEEEQESLTAASQVKESSASVDYDLSQLPEQEQEHIRARRLLEEGRFAEAVDILKRILEQDPDYLAAGNNLALAYYYMGRFDEAISTLHRVLERDSGNLHALCNLAVFERNAGHEEVVSELISLLSKMEPMHREHGYKLATTMGILGEHAEAYRHLKRIANSGSLQEASVFHYAAVAACHMSRYDEAARWWAACRKLDPVSGIATYYLEQLQQMQPETGLVPSPSYHYRLPYDEARSKLQKQDKAIKANIAGANSDEAAERNETSTEWQAQMKRDPLVRSSLFWALRFGEMPARLQALEAMMLLGDEEAKEAVRSLLTDPEQNVYMRQLSYYVLRRLGVREPLQFLSESGMELLEDMYAGCDLPADLEEASTVVNDLREHMDDHYELYMVHDAEVLWLEYLERSQPDAPKVVKAEAWAAAVEYLILKLYQRDVTYQETADRYRVSASTVSKNVKRIASVCGMEIKQQD